MTTTRFYSETNINRYLEIMQFKKNKISIYIDEDGDNDEVCICVDLAISDAEKLMDEIHKAIINIEKNK